MREILSVIWSRVVWRHWCLDKKSPFVLILILSFGVAGFLAVRLANQAAVSGFALFTESITGESDLLVRPRAGTFPESELYSLRLALGSTPATVFPILDTTAASGPEDDAKLYRIIGTDFVALSNLGFDRSKSPALDFAKLLGQSNHVLVGRNFGDGNPIGSQVDLYIDGAKRGVTVVGILQDDPLRPAAPENVLVLDLPAAQDLTGKPGLISRLEIRFPEGDQYEENRSEAQKRIQEWGGDRFIVESPEDRRKSATQMSAAFRLNLSILSMLAMIVGAYLILQAMEASVIKRRSEIAILRCLGIAPRQILIIWMTESVVIGILGSLLGILLGILLSQGLVGGISSTVHTMYYETTTTSAAFHWQEGILAFSFGILVSIVAGWIPARDASRVPPAHAVSRGTRGGGLKILQNHYYGIALTILAIFAANLPPYVSPTGSTIPLGGYISALLFLVGLSILGGALFPLVPRLLNAGSRSPSRCYASSQFRLPEGRHRLAAAGLLTAFGMSAAMGILVASFEHTLTSWIKQILQADIYIATAGSQSASSDHKIPESVWEDIVTTPGIAGVDRIRRYPISFQGKDTWLAGSDYNTSERRLQLIWINPPQDRSADALTKIEGQSHPAWISESFAQNFRKKMGARFTIPTGAGEKAVAVKGIYADYGNERGAIVVSRKFTSQWYQDSSINNMAVYLTDGIDEEQWRHQVMEKHPGIVVRTNRNLRSDALRLFRETFRVTYALEGIAVLIAVAGLGLAMVGLLLERSQELRTLKELGLTRKQIAVSAMWEGIGLSVVGIIGGIIVSLLLGWLLVFVINRQSFGWTLNFQIPWIMFAGLSCALLMTGAVVAWLVGYRIANLNSDGE